MIIESKFFGNIEINEKQIIRFDHGIPGFEHEKKFVILDIEGKEDLKCLQSLEDKEVCLLMMLPWSCFKDYEIDVSDKEIEELGILSHEEVAVYCVLTVREDKITANLVAPIIINVLKNLGKQIILPDTKYNIRQEIPCLY